MASLRPIVHRLHDPEHDDLSLYVCRSRSTLARRRRQRMAAGFKVTAVVDCGADAVVVDRLLEVEPSHKQG